MLDGIEHRRKLQTVIHGQHLALMNAKLFSGGAVFRLRLPSSVFR